MAGARLRKIKTGLPAPGLAAGGGIAKILATRPKTWTFRR